MLTGTFIFGENAYGVSAYDFDDYVATYLTPTTSKARRELDRGIRTSDEVHPATWTSLFVSVAIGSVSADNYIEVTDEGKKKNELNQHILCKFGNIVRGMKAGSTKSNMSEKEEFFTGQFSPTKTIRYNFPSGHVLLEMKTLRELSYHGYAEDENGEVVPCSLELEEDGGYSEKINRHTNTLQKFKLDLSEFVTRQEDEDWDLGGDDTIFSLQEIIERNPDKNYLWLKKRKYYIIKDLNEVEEVCQKIWKHDGIVSFDTETTGLTVNITSRQGIGDRLVGMVFSIEPGVAWYFPVAHKKVKNICDASNEHFIIEKYFKPILEKKDLLCHNGSFDWKVMYNYGIFCNIVHDTMILFKVTLWNDHRTMQLGLKKLTQTFLNRDSFELSDFVQGRFGGNNVKFWDLEEESVKYYACPDTDNLIELFNYCQDNKLLEKYGAKKIYQIEVAFSLVIAYQEYYGHCVDVSRIDDLVKDIKDTKEREYRAMVELVGHDFNPRSNTDLPKVMYEELGYPVFEHTDTGAPSCGQGARKKLMDEQNPDGTDKYPLARHLHNYLESATLESSFTKNISKFATPDGLMFSEVKQFLETGRVSVKSPNYQSYSDEVKHYIVPRTGYYALDADYSSVEARIMCGMAGCTAMVEAMKDPDTDYHTIKASQMFGIPYEMVTHSQRKMAKGVNFGLLYGMGSKSLGAHLYGAKSVENTRKAERQKELYFKGMEELRKFIEDSRSQGVTNFYSTTYFGRRRYFDPRRVRKDTIERQSANARIQGTAADLYKISMIRLLNQLRRHNWLGKVLISGFIHDECYLEVSKSIDPFIMLKILRECMMQQIKGWCPLFIGCGYGHNWYEAKNTEIPIQVQDYFIDTFGETGIDWWDGDTDRLCKYVVDTIHEKGKERVIEYISNPDNHGKVLKPAMNALVHSTLKALKSGFNIPGADLSEGINEPDDMLLSLREFCRIFGCLNLLEGADIRKPDQTVSTVEEEETLEEIGSSASVDKETLIQMRLQTFGVYYNNSSKEPRMYIRYPSNQVLENLVVKVLKAHEGKVPVYTVKDGKVFELEGFAVAPNVYSKLLQTYMSYDNINK